jgi:hypothetical protein
MLQFNFSALIAYEILLTVTAILLARRRIWYDSLLLFGLNNLFIIIPFSLVSRALFLSSNFATMMCLAGCLFVAAKFWAFKRYIPDLYLPRRLLAFGAVLLAANAFAPLHFKPMVGDLVQIGASMKQIWLLLLPALAGAANLLPRPRHAAGSPGQTRWLPQALYAAWIFVTAFHLGGIGYSQGFVWTLAMVAPLAWVLAWTFYTRVTDFVSNPGTLLKQRLLFLPLVIPFLAAGDQRIFPALALLNLLCYGLPFLLDRRHRAAGLPLVISATMLIGGLPAEWLHHVAPSLSRGNWIVCCLLLCLVCWTFISRDPRVALMGVLAPAVGYFMFFDSWRLGTDYLSPKYMMEISLVFVMTHSVRWRDHEHKGAWIFRNIAGLLWVLISFSWLQEPGYGARVTIYSSAGLLLLYYTFHSSLIRSWKPLAVPFYSVAVLFSQPAKRFADSVADISPGFLAIIASFVLFAAGTLAALTKSKWNPPAPALSPSAQAIPDP